MSYLFITLFTYSFIGFVLEIIFALVVRQRLENRKTMLILPLCPVYGVGALMLSAVLQPFKGSILAVILLGAITGTVAEYIYGYLATAIFNVTIWDYSKVTANYKGIISLPFVAIWGILSLLFIYIVHPIINPILLNFPYQITTFLFILFLIDTFFTVKMLIKIGKGKNDGDYYDCPVIKRKIHR